MSNQTPDTSDARVTTITAEVRVLMVGSRQVTLSVFNQLDPVAPGLITPFGRVRGKESGDYRTDVVGVDADGRLCRSWILDDGFQLGYGALGRRFAYSDNEDLAESLRARRAEWKSLPLIVLAGLR